MPQEQSSIDRLIINKPYEEPTEHWKYNREKRKFSREPGRRPAGYLIASGDSKTFDDPGMFVDNSPSQSDSATGEDVERGWLPRRHLHH